MITISPKELAYIEDALSHEQFLMTQCRSAVQQLEDSDLRNQVQQLLDRHQSIYSRFYQLV